MRRKPTAVMHVWEKRARASYEEEREEVVSSLSSVGKASDICLSRLSTLRGSDAMMALSELVIVLVVERLK